MPALEANGVSGSYSVNHGFLLSGNCLREAVETAGGGVCLALRLPKPNQNPLPSDNLDRVAPIGQSLTNPTLVVPTWRRVRAAREPPARASGFMGFSDSIIVGASSRLESGWRRRRLWEILLLRVSTHPRRHLLRGDGFKKATAAKPPLDPRGGDVGKRDGIRLCHEWRGLERIIGR